MKTAQHTPGPWIIAAPIASDMVASIRGALPEAFVAEYGVQGCADFNIAHLGTPYLREVQEANARLIAASPDLLSALQRMTERYTSLVASGDCGNWDPETEEEVIAASAAIRKALPAAGGVSEASAS